MSIVAPLSAKPSPRYDIAVVIPCYRVGNHIAGVLERIGSEVSCVFCIDDASDDDTAAVIRDCQEHDSRIQLINRETNGGVGAATLDGYRTAIADGARVLVKIDGDGQMAPELVGQFAAPVLRGEADYVKGNRFFSMATVRAMPGSRIVGNAGLSFLTKLSTGYWDLFDPTNGFTAIQADVAAALPLEQIHPRYFFESDLLFRLGTIRARVLELPLVSSYGGETSYLSELRSLFSFPLLHLRNLIKRIVYNYFLRNFSLASINLVAGLGLIAFGALFGATTWVQVLQSGQPATAGTVMLVALPLLLGVQLLLGFLAHDIAATPRDVIHPNIAQVRILSFKQAAE